MNTKTKEKILRKDWVDALRAMAIILVVIGHRVGNWKPFFVFTDPIKVPLFFVISGYVFNYDENNTRQFFGKIFRRLMVPWLVLALIPVVMMTPLKGISYLRLETISILTGEKIWYMPCCIVAEIIWFFLHKRLKSPFATAGIASVFYVIGQFMCYKGWLSTFMINRAFSAQLYLMLGYFIKKNETKFGTRNSDSWNVALLSAYILLGISAMIIYPNYSLDIHMNKISSYPIALSMICIGSVMAFGFAKRIKKYPQMLLFLGRNTLVVFVLQGYVAIACIKAVQLCGIEEPGILLGVLMGVVNLTICCVIAWLIDHFVPQLLGRKKKC